MPIKPPEQQAGRRSDPLRGFRFRVFIPGFERLGFKRIGGLKTEIATLDYFEGGDPVPHKLLDGKVLFGDLILERGMMTKHDFFKWQQEYFSAQYGKVVTRQLRLQILNKVETPVVAIEAFEAFPTVLEVDDFDAQSEDVTLVRVQLANRGWIFSSV